MLSDTEGGVSFISQFHELNDVKKMNTALIFLCFVSFDQAKEMKRIIIQPVLIKTIPT
jgi:hypothetical protein